MFSRPYTTLSRIGIEVADCQMNFKNIHGHLTITVERLEPVFPTGNRDPFLAKTSRQKTVHITTDNDNTAIEKDKPQPSTSKIQHNAMVADSTHRSPQVPSTYMDPIHFHTSTVPSVTDLSSVSSNYNEADYPQDDNSESNSDDNDEQDTDPIPMPDPVHMPQKEYENEEIPQEEIPHIEQQNEMPQTQGPSNPSHDNTQPINPESPDNDRPK